MMSMKTILNLKEWAEENAFMLTAIGKRSINSKKLT